MEMESGARFFGGQYTCIRIDRLVCIFLVLTLANISVAELPSHIAFTAAVSPQINIVYIATADT